MRTHRPTAHKKGALLTAKRLHVGVARFCHQLSNTPSCGSEGAPAPGAKVVSGLAILTLQVSPALRARRVEALHSMESIMAFEHWDRCLLPTTSMRLRWQPMCRYDTWSGGHLGCTPMPEAIGITRGTCFRGRSARGHDDVVQNEAHLGERPRR